MRREGYEFQVSRPEAIFKEDEDGNPLEPYEELSIQVGADLVGTVVEMLGVRRGQLMNMQNGADGSCGKRLYRNSQAFYRKRRRRQHQG